MTNTTEDAGSAILEDATTSAQVECNGLLGKPHDHTCHCGTSDAGTAHETGHDGCQRFMTGQPDFTIASMYNYTVQRGYHQHPCGCWSRWEGSTNSLEA